MYCFSHFFFFFSSALLLFGCLRYSSEYPLNPVPPEPIYLEGTDGYGRGIRDSQTGSYMPVQDRSSREEDVIREPISPLKLTDASKNSDNKRFEPRTFIRRSHFHLQDASLSSSGSKKEKSIYFGRSAAGKSSGIMYHLVRTGDTLYSISRRYEVSVSVLIERNRLSSSASIFPGDIIVVAIDNGGLPPLMPGRDRKALSLSGTLPLPVLRPDYDFVSVDVLRLRPAAPESLPLVFNKVPAGMVPFLRPHFQDTSVNLRKKSEQKILIKPKVIALRNSGNSNGFRSKFHWPVKGRILSGFGSRPSGKKNDGINILVPEGTSVKAAESGVVTYVGDAVKGYGYLILIRHQNGWVTAYAHNSRVVVERGDKVRRGQIISKAGMTGSVRQPQLHFEIRKGSRPVDPLSLFSES
ncbi:MAG: M23 family metallopeptidase [Alphaproteobacteria bacterium]|nr:M23 family metallopeptidase [Alphaproteobacteria bacterium]